MARSGLGGTSESFRTSVAGPAGRTEYVHVPGTDQSFENALAKARDGDRAALDGTPVSTTDRSSPDECTLLSGYDPNGAFLSHGYQETRRVHSLGSAALSLRSLASGSADAQEYDTSP